MASHLYTTSGGDQEYVIIGNDVLLKCNIPSFVADFVHVTGWVDSEGVEYLIDNKYGNLNYSLMLFVLEKLHLC